MRLGRSLPPAAAPIRARELICGIRSILDGQRDLDRFQSELKAYFGVKHCFLVSSGRAALALILLALKELFPDRDEVLIPAYTCYSVPASIARAGLRIRLCDLHSESLDFDFAQLSALLSERFPPRREDAHSVAGDTDSAVALRGIAEDARDPKNRILAVVPTHLFGIPADVPRLRELVQGSGIAIVEDATQAMGESSEGSKLGTRGDVGFFSLARGKALSAVEGGVIITDRDDIAEALERHIRSLPQYNLWQLVGLVLKAAALMLLTHPRLFWLPQSLPFLKLGQTLYEPGFEMLRMSSFQAGLTVNWEARLQEMQNSRRRNVSRWIEVLQASGNRGSRLRIFPSMGLLRFPVTIRDSVERQSLLRESARNGLGITAAYPDSINRLPGLSIPGETFSVAESFARQLVTLPTHDYVTQKDVAAIGRLLLHDNSW
jgi:dTDP-4-amino-4,6-dideoxygalactose transaminase